MQSRWRCCAHAVFGDLFTNDRPIHFAFFGHLNFASAFFFEKIQRILRKNPAIPLGSTETRITPSLACEVAGGLIGVVADRLHEFIVEFDRLLRGERNVFGVKRILQTHDAKTDRTVAHVRSFGSLRRVKVNVDDIVQSSDRRADGIPQLLVINRSVALEVRIENDRTKVANGRFVRSGVESDFRAKVGTVNHTDMILRTAQRCRCP